MPPSAFECSNLPKWNHTYSHVRWCFFCIPFCKKKWSKLYRFCGKKNRGETTSYKLDPAISGVKFHLGHFFSAIYRGGYNLYLELYPWPTLDPIRPRKPRDASGIKSVSSALHNRCWVGTQNPLAMEPILIRKKIPRKHTQDDVGYFLVIRLSITGILIQWVYHRYIISLLRGQSPPTRVSTCPADTPWDDRLFTLQDLGCWWKTSCTTWDLQNPVVNNGINHHSTGGCRISEPSTLYHIQCHTLSVCAWNICWINLKGKISQIRRSDNVFCWKHSGWTYMNHKYHPTYSPIPKLFQNTDNPWLKFA